MLTPSINGLGGKIKNFQLSLHLSTTMLHFQQLHVFHSGALNTLIPTSRPPRAGGGAWGPSSSLGLRPQFGRCTHCLYHKSGQVLQQPKKITCFVTFAWINILGPTCDIFVQRPTNRPRKLQVLSGSSCRFFWSQTCRHEWDLKSQKWQDPKTK